MTETRTFISENKFWSKRDIRTFQSVLNDFEKTGNSTFKYVYEIERSKFRLRYVMKTYIEYPNA